MDRLICTHCNATYSLDDPRWRCDCGSYLDIEFNPHFDMERIAGRGPTMWRYREAIPLREDANIVSLGEGCTPLVSVDFGGADVLIKQDHTLPTGSFKDRGASVLVSKVRELGITQVVEDSSGNAGCAIAAYCADAGIGCTIFVPWDVRPEKLARIRRHGATVTRIKADREATASVAHQAARLTYYASHAWNPFFLHGTKTLAYEICEELGWQAPDVIILPVGNGTLLLGVFIGMKDLVEAGITAGLPRLIAVQSAQCAPLYQAFREGVADVPAVVKGSTVADGIAVASPVRGIQILKAVAESKGDFITVTDDEIMASLSDMSGRGFCIEPTAAATTAGILRYLAASGSDDMIVSVFTGNGLKTAEE